ncbi:MAG: PKD domain-containing protein, partial [Flavisolibacter sp.]
MRSVKSFGLHYLVLLLVFFIHSFSVQGQYVQTPRPNVPINADCNGYLETLPQEYATSNQSYPLLVFLEGIQEAGSGSFDDLQKLYNNGPPYLIKNGLFPSTFSVNAQTFRFIIITPQFSIPLWQRYPSPAEINGIIDYMVQHYRVDQSRIYLTGLSTGGGSVFYYAGASSTYANRLAAIVPFASTYGTSDSTEFTRAAVEPRARTMAAANLPVWAFHNKYDSGVPDSITINYVNYMNEAPAPNPPARATIFDASGHECWYNAYNSAYTENNLTIYQWMLQYSRGSSPPPVNKPPVVNAGANQTITLPTSSVTLSGSASDPDGTIAAYQWTKVSGGNVSFGSPAAVSTTVSGLAQGSYIFRLTATDNSGASAYADVTVTVNGSSGGGTTTRIEAENWSAMSGVATESAWGDPQ